MYGPFTNELLLGRVLKERRADAFVSTKCGLLVASSTSSPTAAPAMCAGPATRRCGACRPTSSTSTSCTARTPRCPVEETWGAMAELVAAGKVRALGLCAVGARRRAARGGGRRTRLHEATIRQLRARAAGVPGERGGGGAVGVVAGGAGGAAAVVRGARRRLPGGDAARQRLPDRHAHPGAGLRAGRHTGPASPFHRRDDGREPADRGGAAPGRRAARRDTGAGGAGLGAAPRAACGPGARGRSGSAGRRRTPRRRSWR